MPALRFTSGRRFSENSRKLTSGFGDLPTRATGFAGFPCTTILGGTEVVTTLLAAYYRSSADDHVRQHNHPRSEECLVFNDYRALPVAEMTRLEIKNGELAIEPISVSKMRFRAGSSSVQVPR